MKPKFKGIAINTTILSTTKLKPKIKITHVEKDKNGYAVYHVSEPTGSNGEHKHEVKVDRYNIVLKHLVKLHEGDKINLNNKMSKGETGIHNAIYEYQNKYGKLATTIKEYKEKPFSFVNNAKRNASIENKLKKVFKYK